MTQRASIAASFVLACAGASGEPLHGERSPASGPAELVERQPRGMITFRSRRYQVTTDLDRADAEDIARHMDRVYDEYDRRFASFGVKASKSFTLYLFRRNADYIDFLRRDGVNAANTGGIFYVGPEGDGLATFVEGQTRESLLHTLRHEGFHQFAWARIGRNLPPWANEGIAEYFGNARETRVRFLLGRVDDATLAGLQRAIEGGRSIPFSKLLTMSSTEWGTRVASGDGDAGLLYDQSWSIVHFLIEGDRGRYAGMFSEYLRCIASGMTHRQAFEKSFGTRDESEFEAAWKRHVSALEPDPLSTASLRLTFLARGLQALHEAGSTPATFEELRRTLEQVPFKAKRFTAAGWQEWSAANPGVFDIPPEKPGGPATTPELVAGVTPDLPPELHARVGRTALTIRWRRAKSGELGFDLEIE